MSSGTGGGAGGPPTLLARRYVTYLVGFGVAVATGAAVFLGMSRVPLFSPLLGVIPEELRELLLPLSSFLVGLVALAVQFYAGERIVRSRLRRRFGAGLVLLLFGLVALLALRLAYVVPRPGLGDQPAFMMIGLWRRAECPCGTVSAYECLNGLAFDPTPCWSGASVTLAKLSLSLSYLALIGGFGALVGLLLLQETARRQEAARKRKPSRSRRPARKRKRAAADERAAPAERPDEPAEGEGSERSISVPRQDLVAARASGSDGGGRESVRQRERSRRWRER